MFSGIKIINSKNKCNIRFVAAGSYQIEFFEHKGSDYFTIYKFNYGGEGQAHYLLVKLNGADIAQISDTEIQIIQGSNTYKLHITEKNNQNIVHVTRYILGWLPLSRFGGKVSKAGLSALKSGFEGYANDLAS